MSKNEIVFTEFNSNDYVYVELTDEGWALLRAHYSILSDEDFENYWKKLYTKKYVVNGEEKMLTQMQLHAAIRSFGKMSVCAFHEPFKNCRVYFNSKDLVPTDAA
jgi:hypothetical protein